MRRRRSISVEDGEEREDLLDPVLACYQRTICAHGNSVGKSILEFADDWDQYMEESVE